MANGAKIMTYRKKIPLPDDLKSARWPMKRILLNKLMEKMQNTDSISAIELADRLSVTPGRIRQIALSLGLSRKGRDWLFTADDADRIAEHTRAGQNFTLLPVNAKAK